MNAKSFSVKSFSPSGTTLLVSLAIALSLAAIAFDWKTGVYASVPSAISSLRSGSSMALAFWGCTLLVAAVGYWAVPLLQKLKAGQVIREDGPQAHLQKAGTPTMGGIFLVPMGVLVALLWSQLTPEVVAVSLMTLAYAAIGWVDDWQILKRKSNKGISPRMKLGLQIVIGVLFCLWLGWSRGTDITTVDLPFGLSLPLGWLFWPLVVFVFAAESNATNLTDGVDGLAAGTGAIALLGLGALAAPISLPLMLFCACLSGSYVGFLIHNRRGYAIIFDD